MVISISFLWLNYNALIYLDYKFDDCNVHFSQVSLFLKGLASLHKIKQRYTEKINVRKDDESGRKQKHTKC